MKAHQLPGEAVRATTTIPHCVLLFTLLVVLVSSIGGDRLFRNHFAVQTTAPSGSGTSESAGNRFARDGKVPGPQLGAKQLPGEGPRESAETKHTSPQPSRCVRSKGAAPLSGAEEQTAMKSGTRDWTLLHE